MSEKSLTTLSLPSEVYTEGSNELTMFKFKRGVHIANRVLAKYKGYQLDQERLIQKAIKKTGLNDFGSDFWLRPMKKLIDDINEHTNFHPLGALLYEQKMIQNLENRLWSQYWLDKDPAIQRELPPILMITGLQRTGTTFLQRLVGSLPEFRGIKSWEIINPVPTSKKKSYDGEFFAWAGLKGLNYINPEFRAIHAINYDSLDEEVVLMEHSFMSTVIEASMSVPNFAVWLEQQDQIPAYEDLKMWLQFLVWREAPKSHLLLKSPHHMEYMDQYMTVFPDSKVIQMHRNPVDTMGSYCSMMLYAKKMFQNSADPAVIGRHWLRKNKRLLTKSMEYRRDHPDAFVDLSYSEFVHDPITTVERIYSELGLRWADEHVQIAQAYCAEHYKNKHGRHVYNLTDYGLSPEIIEREYGFYMDAFSQYF